MNNDMFAGMVDGYGALDGTIEFYGRLHTLVGTQSTVLNLGAGRGAWHDIDTSMRRRALQDLKPVVKLYVGADIDPAVLSNPTTHRNALITDDRVPLEDASCDVVVCDYVLEHVDNIAQFEREVRRVLKPGGWFCARTPHFMNYVCIAARLIANTRHARVLGFAQPGRLKEDVFPTRYRCNTLRRLAAVFPRERWRNFSYLYTAEPSYFFGSRMIFSFLSLAHRILPLALTGNIFIFLQKID